MDGGDSVGMLTCQGSFVFAFSFDLNQLFLSICFSRKTVYYYYNIIASYAKLTTIGWKKLMFESNLCYLPISSSFTSFLIFFWGHTELCNPYMTWTHMYIVRPYCTCCTTFFLLPDINGIHHDCYLKAATTSRLKKILM
jgi:hypothetical protein